MEEEDDRSPGEDGEVTEEGEMAPPRSPDQGAGPPLVVDDEEEPKRPRKEPPERRDVNFATRPPSPDPPPEEDAIEAERALPGLVHEVAHVEVLR